MHCISSVYHRSRLPKQDNDFKPLTVFLKYFFLKQSYRLLSIFLAASFCHIQIIRQVLLFGRGKTTKRAKIIIFTSHEPTLRFPPPYTQQVEGRDLHWCHVTFSITCNFLPTHLATPHQQESIPLLSSGRVDVRGDVIISFPSPLPPLKFPKVRYQNSFCSILGKSRRL
ncbi:hypothetical protein CDAR_269521 [Caerostris darwini]|uniref:Uncharacterized protein n=1 Tax=Caerostris darwini TaxID=1538125 RepID=A0AAV4VQD0_9ARAC|nr:hypothetical protein CDAR_269521 [Caerostris darwini]